MNDIPERWGRLPLLWRLQVAVGLVLLLTSSLLLLTTLRSDAAHIRDDLQQVLAQKLRTLPLALRDPVQQGDYASLEQALRLHAQGPDIRRISFTDSQGTSVQALGRLAQWQVSAYVERWLAVADIAGRVPMQINGRGYGEFEVEVGAARLVERLQERLLAMLGFLAVALLLSYLLLWRVVARSLAPLHDLERGAQDLAAGRLSGALPLAGSGEIRHVVAAFNDMAGQLHESERQLLAREALFKTAINSSRHLAGLLDPEGRMLMVNETALTAVGCSWAEVEGTFFADGPWWQGLPQERAKLLGALEQVRQGRVASFETMHVLQGEQRIIDFSIRPLFDPQGRIIYLLPEGIDVTARHRAVAAMEAVHQRFQSVFNAANVGIVLSDAAGIAIECNQALLDLLALSRGELLGHRFDSVIHPDDLDRVRAGVQRMLLAGEDSFRGETRYLTPVGKVRWVDLVVSVVRQADGSVQGMVSVASDISSRKQVEAAADAASRMQQTLLDNCAVGIVLCSEDRRILRVNAHAGRMFDYSPQQLEGKSVRELHLDDQHFQEFSQNYQQLHAGQSVVLEYPYRRRDGSALWCAVSGAPLDREDPSKGIIWTLLDISERRRAAKEKQDSEQRLSLALEGAGLGLWDWHLPSGRVEFNGRWAEMLGYRQDELVPEYETWARLVHPADLPLAKARIDAYLRGDSEDYHCEHRMLHRDGRWVWVLASGRLIESDDSGSPLRMVGIHVDISANKNAEQIVRSREQHLQALLSAMSDVVFLIDTAGRFSEFHWPAHTPYQPPQAESFIGQDYNAFLPEAATAMVDEAIARMMVDGGPYSAELVLELGGEARCFHATFSLLTDAAGYPQGFLCVARDITERKAEEAAVEMARREIERLSQRNELLLNSAGDGIYGVNLDGSCSFINPAALELLGYQAEQVIGHNQHELFHHHRPDGSHYPAAECPVYQTLCDGERRETEEVFIHSAGHPVPVHLTVTPMREHGQLIGAEVVFQDISLRKAMEQELLRLATTDALTGLPNRRHFMEQLDHELARIKRFGKPACLLMLDLDHFKRVNDTYGHAAGDTVLRHFASLAQASLREIDLIGRLGGEEFGVLLPGTTLPGAIDLAERLRESIAAAPVAAGEQRIAVTVSIGIAEFNPTDPHPDDILARADVALYKAKESGRNRVCPQ